MIQPDKTAAWQLGEQLAPAYHRSGGETLEGCLRTGQALVDEMVELLSGEDREDARFHELLAEAGVLLDAPHGAGATELGLLSLLSRNLPRPGIWQGVGLDRISSRRVKVRGPGSRGGFVLAWTRSQLEEPPPEAPLTAELLPPGVEAQAVVLDEEPGAAGTPLVGRVIRAELFWQGRG